MELVFYEEELNWDLKKYNYLTDLHELEILDFKYPLKLNIENQVNCLSTVIEGRIREDFHKVKLEISFDDNTLNKVKLTSMSEVKITEYDLKYFYLESIKGSLFDIRDRNKKKFTIRNYRKLYNTSNIKSSCKVNAENKFIFGPLFELDREEPLTEHILYFDIEVEANNLDSARSMAHNKISDISSYLSVIFDVGIEEVHSGFSHFVEKKNNGLITRRLRTGFIDEQLSLVVKDNLNGIATTKDALNDKISGFINYSSTVNMKEVTTHQVGSSESLDATFNSHRLYKVQMKNIQTTEDYDLGKVHYAGHPITIPSFIGEYFKCIDSLRKSDNRKYILYRNACRLYNLSLALFHISPTAHIAYLVSSVETLAKVEQLSFSDFIRNNVEDVNGKLLDFIYGNVRSGHFHAGEFPFFEFDVEINNSINNKFFNARNDFLEAKSLIREAFTNWIKVNLLK